MVIVKRSMAAFHGESASPHTARPQSLTTEETAVSGAAFQSRRRFGLSLMHGQQRSNEEKRSCGVQRGNEWTIPTRVHIKT